MAIQNADDVTYKVTLVANTALSVPVPPNVKTAVFGVSTQTPLDFYVDGNRTAAATASSFSAAKATVHFSAPISGGGSTGLFPGTPGTQTVNVGGAKTGASATGLANDTTSYTATITIDENDLPVELVGSTVQTYTLLLAGINTAIDGYGVASLSGGNILVTSDSDGIASTVSIVDTAPNLLFSSLTGYVAINPGVPGTDEFLYTAVLNVNKGNDQTITIEGGVAITFTDLVSSLNGQVAGGTFAITGGALVFTNTLTGINSTVYLSDTGSHPLFSSLTNETSITSVNGAITQGSKLNPSQLRLNGITTLSLISAGTPSISISFVPVGQYNYGE